MVPFMIFMKTKEKEQLELRYVMNLEALYEAQTLSGMIMASMLSQWRLLLAGMDWFWQNR